MRRNRGRTTPLEEPAAFDPYHRIIESLIVEDIDDHLYRIGLCFDSVRDNPKRLAIDHPLFGLFFVTLYIIIRLITYTLR